MKIGTRVLIRDTHIEGTVLEPAPTYLLGAEAVYVLVDHINMRVPIALSELTAI